MLTYIRNWSCDGDSCVQSHGEVRVYPLGSGIDAILCVRSRSEVRARPLGKTSELILCRACWDRANHLRQKCGQRPMNWDNGKVYTWAPEPELAHCYEHAVQEAAWNAMRRDLAARPRRRGIVRRRCQWAAICNSCDQSHHPYPARIAI